MYCIGKKVQTNFNKNGQTLGLAYLLTCKCAIFKWVSGISRWAGTQNIVILNDFAISICSTSIRTWVFAFHVDTDLVIRTVWTENTFRLARAQGVTNVITHTFADCTSIQHKTLRVFSTRWGITWVLWWSRIDFDFLTSNEWVSSETCSTRTDRVVGDHRALGIDAACARTRVYTFVSDAGQLGRTIWLSCTLRTTSLGR